MFSTMRNNKTDRVIVKVGLSLALCLAFSTFGCATTKNKPKRPLFQPASATEKDITVSIREIGREELVKKYKTVDNPYIAPPSFGGGNEMIVFELTVTAPTEIKLLLNDIEFHYGQYFVRPINGFHLSQYWDQRIQRQSTYKGWTSARVEQIIKRTMIPPKHTVKPNEPYTGLVVFMGKFPAYGETSLHIPVFTKDEELVHLFEL